MAEEIRFQGGADVKLRDPWVTWILAIITLGIYALVWWYKINREVRDYSAAAGQPLNNSPGVSVLAIFPGGFLIIPPFWTVVTTCGRIRRVRHIVEGAGESPNGLVAVLLHFVLSLHIVYMAYPLRELWQAARARAGAGLPELEGAAPPPAAPAPPAEPPAEPPAPAEPA
jgi:hypothetical protein